MKTRRLAPRPGRNPRRRLALIALTLLLVAGLFLASVVLPPLNAPAQAQIVPPPAASLAPGSTGMNGTLASFTALIPELGSVYMPFVSH